MLTKALLHQEFYSLYNIFPFVHPRPLYDLFFLRDDQRIFTDERKQELIDLSQKEDIYERLARALGN